MSDYPVDFRGEKLEPGQTIAYVRRAVTGKFRLVEAVVESVGVTRYLVPGTDSVLEWRPSLTVIAEGKRRQLTNMEKVVVLKGK